MSWNTWIEIQPEDTTDVAAQNLYNRTRDFATGHPPDIVRLMSLTPSVANLLFDLQRTIFLEATGLSIQEKEIAALIVSSFNGCVH